MAALSHDGDSAPTAGLVCRGVTGIEIQNQSVVCLLSDHEPLPLSPLMGHFVRRGDHVEFAPTGATPGRELRVLQDGRPKPNQLYAGTIGYVAHPKADKRGEFFVRAEVAGSDLGVKQLVLRNRAVRDYFYFGNRRLPGCEESTLYDLLRVPASSSATDLRLALKIRLVELESANATKDKMRGVERAFNILANPELRSCYDSLLVDTDAPALFPYGGFGSIVVAGELSDDRSTFFGTRIVAFSPENRTRRFRAPLRKVEFLNGRAVYRDARRKAEVFLDELLLPLPWDATWNQWKHLVGTKFGVDSMFVKCGKYRLRRGEWKLVTWETAVPSRIRLSLPADMQEAIATARRTYSRFGRYFDVMQAMRARIERDAVEREELSRLCAEQGVPPDFDIAQISWKPDYDSFFYNQLRKRSRKLFLFRDEYIFELERAVVVEVPEQGHATYVFSRPTNLEHWVRIYSKSSKDEIRRNRMNAAEHLGFIARVMHGRNPRTWLAELRAKIGESVDYSLAMETK